MLADLKPLLSDLGDVRATRSPVTIARDLSSVSPITPRKRSIAGKLIPLGVLIGIAAAGAVQLK